MKPLDIIAEITLNYLQNLQVNNLFHNNEITNNHKVFLLAVDEILNELQLFK